MFFSLHQSLTNNKILNIKYLSQLRKVVIEGALYYNLPYVTIPKEMRQLGSLSLQIVTITKKHLLAFGFSYLAFSHRLMQ